MFRHDDEPQFDLIFLEMLRHDIKLTIPSLEGAWPADHSKFEVTGNENANLLAQIILNCRPACNLSLATRKLKNFDVCHWRRH